jgi:hypothetical protein
MIYKTCYSHFENGSNCLYLNRQRVSHLGTSAASISISKSQNILQQKDDVDSFVPTDDVHFQHYVLHSYLSLQFTVPTWRLKKGLISGSNL